jgi:hypothetical protein
MNRATGREAEAIRVYAESYIEASQAVYTAVGFQEYYRLAFNLRVFGVGGAGRTEVNSRSRTIALMASSS